MSKFVEFNYLYEESVVINIDQLVDISPSTNILSPNGTKFDTTFPGGGTIDETPAQVQAKLDNAGWKKEHGKTDKVITLTHVNNYPVQIPVEHIVFFTGFRNKHPYSQVFYSGRNSPQVKETAEQIFRMLGS